MERGELAVDGRLAVVFVFDGLLANCPNPRIESRAVRRRRWEAALDCWVFDFRVCDYAVSLMSRYDVPVEVITWHPHGFAQVLSDRLYDMDMPVRDVMGGDYERLSQQIAIDHGISTVYDSEPTHRWGYGFKCRGKIDG